MTQLVNILKFALPGAIAIATLEALFLALVMRKNYNWRAYFASLADALGREYIVASFLTISLAAPIIGFAYRHRLFTIPLDTTAAVVLLVIGQDFCYYWFHRASHRIRWFWATHAIHHSSNELNLGASFRFGWASGHHTPEYSLRQHQGVMEAIRDGRAGEERLRALERRRSPRQDRLSGDRSQHRALIVDPSPERRDGSLLGGEGLLGAPP